MKEIPILTYANDLIGKDVGRNTQSRCDETLDLIVRENISGPVLLTAGRKRKDRPSLKKAMYRYLAEQLKARGFQGSFWMNTPFIKGPQTIILMPAPEQAYGSYPETQMAVKILKELGYTELIVVTGENHMPRVKYIWKTYFPEYTVRFVPSKWEWSWRLFLELVYLPFTYLGFKSKHELLQTEVS